MTGRGKLTLRFRFFKLVGYIVCRRKFRESRKTIPPATIDKGGTLLSVTTSITLTLHTLTRARCFSVAGPPEHSRLSPNLLTDFLARVACCRAQTKSGFYATGKLRRVHAARCTLGRPVPAGRHPAILRSGVVLAGTCSLQKQFACKLEGGFRSRGARQWSHSRGLDWLVAGWLPEGTVKYSRIQAVGFA